MILVLNRRQQQPFKCETRFVVHNGMVRIGENKARECGNVVGKCKIVERVQEGQNRENQYIGYGYSGVLVSRYSTM